GVELPVIDHIHSSQSIQFAGLRKPIFITVGSLIPRKNMELIVETFASDPGQSLGSLVVLGDGPLAESLKKEASANVHFFGNVSNVADYLANSDYFVSASFSEGLP